MMKDKKKLLLPGLILAVAAVLILALCAVRDTEAPAGTDSTLGSTIQSGATASQPRDPEGETLPQQGSAPTQSTAPDRETDPQEQTQPQQTQPQEQAPVTPEAPVILEEGLRIEQTGSYSGMYVEDGSGDIVTDIMMIVLRNQSGEDLQLARIEMAVQGETYSFECTNLPAGEAAVLLEKDRRAAAEARPEQAQVTLMKFFDSPMERSSDLLRIEGQKGSLTVTNVSDQDISGDIYVYYKFHAVDHYYGGITFRVAIRGGLEAGKSSQTIAGHYNPDSCRIVQVTHGS